MYARVGIFLVLFLAGAGALLSLSGFSPTATAAPAQTFTINGVITEGSIPNSGPGISGVTITLLVRPSTETTAQTDSGGNFSFANVPAGSDFEVTPAKLGWNFQPTSQGGILN